MSPCVGLTATRTAGCGVRHRSEYRPRLVNIVSLTASETGISRVCCRRRRCLDILVGRPGRSREFAGSVIHHAGRANLDRTAQRKPLRAMICAENRTFDQQIHLVSAGETAATSRRPSCFGRRAALAPHPRAGPDHRRLPPPCRRRPSGQPVRRERRWSGGRQARRARDQPSSGDLWGERQTLSQRPRRLPLTPPSR